MNLILGDCFSEIPKLENESLDLVLTDFPYGISFMGKDWDSVDESFYYKVGKTLLPKMKPGSFLVTTFTPRMDMLWRCLSELEKAGFEMKTSPLFWLYHTGFPKASDISKGIDKQKGLKGKVIGKEKIDVGVQSSSMHAGRNSKLIEREINAPASKEAKGWSGWKSFQLKPSVEVIIAVQKPRTEKTIVGQVLENGCGAVNVEACRIPYEQKDNIIAKNPHTRTKGTDAYDSICYGKYNAKDDFIDYTKQAGRFPANLLVSEEPLKGKESKSNLRNPNNKLILDQDKGWNQNRMVDKTVRGCNDSGTANRFYSLDAWWEKRNITLCEDSAFFDVPKPGKNEKNKGLDGFEEKSMPHSTSMKGSVCNLPVLSGTSESCNCKTKKEIRQKSKNNHPTTKPVKLFTYLAELFSKKNSVVLDPFMGSGTTGIACSILERKFIGIELEKDYFEIAEARIKESIKQQKVF